MRRFRERNHVCFSSKACTRKRLPSPSAISRAHLATNDCVLLRGELGFPFFVRLCHRERCWCGVLFRHTGRRRRGREEALEEVNDGVVLRETDAVLQNW